MLFSPLTVALRALALLLLAAAVGGCSRGPTVKDTIVDGYKGKALADPFLALKRAMEAQGAPFTEPRSPDGLAAAGALVIVPAEASGATTQLLLENARERGGHVVLFFDGTRKYRNDFKDDILSWSFDRDPRGRELTLKQLNIRKAEPPAKHNPADPLKFQPLPGQEIRHEVKGDKWGFFDAKGQPRGRVVWSASKEREATPAVTLQHGRGQVTLFSTAQPFRNTALKEADNAAFFVNFFRSTGAPYAAFLGAGQQSLFSLLWERFGRVSIGVVLLVGLWLWRWLPRFGPLLLPNPQANAARFTDHLQLSGHFLWRRGQSAWLLQGLRTAIQRRLRVRHPHLLALDDAELAPRLAALAQLPAERFTNAWMAGYEKKAEDFTEFAADLQTVYRSLS